MAKQFITISVRNERLTFDSRDWAAIQKTVQGAIEEPGKWHRQRGEESVPAAIGFTVASKGKIGNGSE
ncbi:hypothetical protein [Halomonas caseinilytica]|uniref:hypothetical protein n=1 Tax=Halomonas caseinilytica TaxID=438744 RepID=UPI000848C9DC|nr:hypothetical protein [Halomonas caseinilytica]